MSVGNNFAVDRIPLLRDPSHPRVPNQIERLSAAIRSSNINMVGQMLREEESRHHEIVLEVLDSNLHRDTIKIILDFSSPCQILLCKREFNHREVGKGELDALELASLTATAFRKKVVPIQQKLAELAICRLLTTKGASPNASLTFLHGQDMISDVESVTHFRYIQVREIILETLNISSFDARKIIEREEREQDFKKNHDAYGSSQAIYKLLRDIEDALDPEAEYFLPEYVKLSEFGIGVCTAVRMDVLFEKLESEFEAKGWRYSDAEEREKCVALTQQFENVTFKALVCIQNDPEKVEVDRIQKRCAVIHSKLLALLNG